MVYTLKQDYTIVKKTFGDSWKLRSSVILIERVLLHHRVGLCLKSWTIHPEPWWYFDALRISDRSRDTYSILWAPSKTHIFKNNPHLQFQSPHGNPEPHLSQQGTSSKFWIGHWSPWIRTIVGHWSDLGCYRSALPPLHLSCLASSTWTNTPGVLVKRLEPENGSLKKIDSFQKFSS